MQTHDIAPHLATITRALGDKIGTEVSESDLQEELQKYLDYGVPPDQAVRTILRHYGEAPAPSANKEPPVILEGRIKLADAPANAQSVDLLVRLVTVNLKTVTARGEEKQIVWGLIGDESGTLPYTSWRPLEGLEKGDVIEVQGAYTKEWNGEVQINFGDRSRIAKKDPSELPNTPQEFRPTTVAELREGLRGFRLDGRIVSVDTREVQVQGEPKTLWTGYFADSTGKIEYTCWDDVGLEAGAAISLEGGYIRSFRGVPQLNFDSSANITPFDGELPPAEELAKASTMTIADILDAENVGDASITATLLEVRPGSGLVWRDAETNRVVASNTPNATPDLRIKMILDDGTGAVSAVVGRAHTEALLGKDLDACLAEAKEAMSHDVIADQLAGKLTGRNFYAEGFARTDDYGTMFIARSLEPFQEDTEAAAQEILDALEVA